MSKPPLIHIAGRPDRVAKLPELLRSLIAHGECEQCRQSVAFHGRTRDMLADAARRAGRRLLTVCDDCGRHYVRDGGALMPCPTITLARDIQRAKAERQ